MSLYASGAFKEGKSLVLAAGGYKIRTVGFTDEYSYALSYGHSLSRKVSLSATVNGLQPARSKWMRCDLIVLDEVEYVPLADIGAVFLFQVIAESAEVATFLMTTNLPFSECTTVLPNPRLCKAVLDRITAPAHIIETGIESFPFKSSMERRAKKRPKGGQI